MLNFGIRTWLKNSIYRPNKDAVFIFGLQKSGTSAIAGLLAECTDKSVTIDTKYLWYPKNEEIISGKIRVEDYVRKFSHPFSKDIIKEPNSTFFIEQLQEYFYLHKYIFILRNPLDNIRSILNRLGLPGDKQDIDLNDVPVNWRSMFNKTKGKDHITVLANRWVEANSQSNIIKSDACILIKYEDFLLDKERCIESIAHKIGFKPKKSIKHIMDKQFQPKGNPDADLMAFFKERNYDKIINICGDIMEEYNYKY